MITSSGYRIGPGEIEDCLAGHPDVAMAAVVGVPDPIRTEAVKAFVVLRAGAAGRAREALIARVRARLSPHVAPREVVFVDEPADDRDRQDPASRAAGDVMAEEHDHVNWFEGIASISTMAGDPRIPVLGVRTGAT